MRILSRDDVLDEVRLVRLVGRRSFGRRLTGSHEAGFGDAYGKVSVFTYAIGFGDPHLFCTGGFGLSTGYEEINGTGPYGTGVGTGRPGAINCWRSLLDIGCGFLVDFEVIE